MDDELNGVNPGGPIKPLKKSKSSLGGTYTDKVQSLSGKKPSKPINTNQASVIPPKKTYTKPSTTKVEGQFSFDLPKRQQNLGAEIIYNSIPKSTASIAAYSFGGLTDSLGSAVNALGSTHRNAMDRPLIQKNLESSGSKQTKQNLTKYQQGEVENYINLAKKAKGKNDEGFLTRAYATASLLSQTVLKNTINYGGMGVGHGLDIVDMLQTVKLPSHYDLKDFKTSMQQAYLGAEDLTRRTSVNMLAGLGIISEKSKVRMNKSLDKYYEKESIKYNKIKELNYNKEKQANLKGTIEQEKQEFYSKYFLGGLNTNLNIMNAVADVVDNKVFRDKDNGSNWFTNIAQGSLDQDDLIRREAQYILDNEEKDAKFKQAAVELTKKYKGNPDLLATSLDKAKEEIYSKQRSQEFFSDKWDEDKRSPFRKIFDAESYEGFEDFIDVDNKIMPMVGQALGTIIAAEATLGGFKSISSLGKAGGRITSNTTKSVLKSTSNSKYAEALAAEVQKLPRVPVGKPVKKFTEVTSKLMQKPSVLRAYDLTKSNLKAMPFSYAMAYDESRQIGQQVYEKAVEDKLGEATGVTKELFYRQYTPQNGESFSPQEYSSMDKDYEEQVVKKYMQENPDNFKKIITLANEASDLATTTNLIPETLGNMVFFSKYFEGKKLFSRSTQKFLPFTEKLRQMPGSKIAVQAVKTGLVEGGLEEAGVNMIAQRKGEKFVEGEYYHFDDYKKEVGGKDFMENFAGGLIMGVPQNLAMSVSSGDILRDIQNYKQYKKVLNDYKELSKFTGKDELSNFIANNLDVNNADTFAKKETEIINKVKALNEQLKNTKPKSPERKEIEKQIQSLQENYEKENNKLILSKINNAFQTGTAHKLISTLENMSKEESISQEDQANLLDMIDSIKKLEVVYNENLDKSDSGKIISNRFASIVNRKNLIKLDTQLTGLSSKRDEALKRISRLNARAESRMFKAKPIEGSPEVAQWRDTTKAYKERYEQHLANATDAFYQGDDLGDIDLREYNLLVSERDKLEEDIDNNETEFKKLISEDYQRKVEPKNNYYRDLNKIYSDEKLSEDKKKKEKSKIIKRYSNVLEKQDFDAVENEILTKLENQKELEKHMLEKIRLQEDKVNKEQKELEEAAARKVNKDIKNGLKSGQPISVEKQVEIDKKVNAREIPKDLTTPEQHQINEQEKIDLFNKEKLAKEEEARLKELSDKTALHRSRETLDNLIPDEDTPKVKASEIVNDSEREFLESMGINVDELEVTSARAENFVPSPGDVGARAINLEDEDDNYSPGIINPDKDGSHPFKDFVEQLIFDISVKEDIPEEEVTIQDVINRLLEVAGKDKAERSWNILVEGYKLARPDKAVNFERLYDTYFTDRLATLNNLLDEYIIPEDTTGSIEETVKPEEPVVKSSEVKPIFDGNNKPVVAPVTQAIPVGDTLVKNPEPKNTKTDNERVKKSHLQLGKNYLLGILPTLFDKTSNYVGNKIFPDVNFGNLFNLKNYQKYKSDKLPMTLTIPENYMDVMVKADSDLKYKFMPFSEWEAHYGYTKGSPEWINKVPILASFEGSPSFYLNDATASQTMNIIEFDLNDSPEINSAKKQYFTYVNNNIRQKVFNGGSHKVLVKTNQVDLSQGQTGNQPLINFGDEVQIGSWDPKAGVFKVNGKIVPTTNEVFSNFSKHSSTVMLKPVGVNEKGEIKYQAFEVNTSGLLGRSHTGSLMAALYSYLGRNISDQLSPGHQNFRETLKEKSNIDLENYTDLNKYINSISRTSSFERVAKTLGLAERDNSGVTIENKIKNGFADFINDPSNKALPGQPMLSIIDYKIVFAIKPEKSVNNPLGLITPENISVIDPINITSKELLDEAAKEIIHPYYKALNSKATSININQGMLADNKPYVLINNNNPNKTVEYSNYNTYAKNFLVAPNSVSIRQIPNPDGTTTNAYGTYAVIEITEENGFEKSFEEFLEEKQGVQKKVEDKKKAEKILKDKEKEKPKEEQKEVTSEDVDNLVALIEKAEKAKLTLIKNNLSTEAIDKKLSELKGEYQTLTGENYTTDNFSPTVITDAQIQEMIEKEKDNFRDIAGLSLYERQDIVNNLFNEIAGPIGYKKASKKKILGDIKNKLFGIIDQNIANNNSEIEVLEDLGLSISTQELRDKTQVLENIKNQYNEIEEDVLELLEEKVGIKEVRDKKSGDIIKDEQADGSELDAPEDPTENPDDDKSNNNEVDKDLVDRDKSFNSSSLEVTGKTTVSAKMKRFLAKIPILNKAGVEETGYLGLVRYYDFKDLDNEIKVALNTPSEIDSDYDTVIKKLQSIQDEYSWAKPLLNKLTDKDTPEQTRIEFMYNYTGRHSISSKFIEFELNSRGKFTTVVFDANFTDIAKNIRKTWEDSVKNSSVYDSTADGSYEVNPEVAKSLYETFVNITKQLGESQGLPFNRANLSVDLKGIEGVNSLNAGESFTVQKNNISTKIYAEFEKQLETQSKVVYKINNEELIEVSKDFDGNIVYTKPRLSENIISNLSDWLTAVGLDINAATLTDLTTSGLDLGKKGNLTLYDLLDLKNFNSPFSKIANNLAAVSKRVDAKSSLDIQDFNILEGSGDSLLALAKVESKHTKKVITKNFRDNGKLIQGLPIGKYATDRINQLKSKDSGVLDNLSKLSFSSNSMLGELLRDPEFAEKFMIAHTANGVFKKKDGKFQKNAKITDLTALDLEVTKLGFFFETNNVARYNQTLLGDFRGEGDTRMGYVFLPTMSDKDQMMAIQTLVFNINNFNYKDGKLSEPILELLYSQLVKGELNRIINFHAKGGKTDIKGYDEAAQLFNLLPMLNNITDENGNTLPNLIKTNPKIFDIKFVEAHYKDIIKQEINSLVNHLTEEKLSTWKDLEIIDKKNNIKINSKYLDTRKEDKKDKDSLNRNLAAEFVLNNLVTNANMHMLVIGDPALYSQSKFFNKDRFEDGDPTKPLDPSVYREWSESSLGTNLGKRLALMLAPGNKLYNSKNDAYHQIYLKDFVDMSSNILDLVQDFYGKNSRNNAEVLVNEIKSLNKKLAQEDLSKEDTREIENIVKTNIKTLKNSYPKLADYFEIESTDAQEYTTISEHINVMRRQGRIEDKKFEQIEAKLKAQQKEANSGNPISKENYLTKEELGFVLQPIKPVYTGQIFDQDQDVARTVYVKSSSFTLIPQLTYGKPIDGVRKVMEQYEAKSGYKVRASYDTANKVGASKNAISPFNADGSFNTKSFSLENIDSAKLELNRNNFRIQQDVPNKSDKGVEDRISYGTQMLKILFSNGVIDVKGGFLNPDFDLEDNENNEDIKRTLSGKDLFDKYNNAFIDLVNIKKEQLYKELGVDKNGFVKDPEKFKKSIAKLLNKEGKKRDYSKNDLASIKLTEDNQFVLPLFLNNQSGKIESLLLSIIASRVVKHKLPGYYYVAGSEAGFKLEKVEDVSDVEGRDRIIYTQDFSGELKGTLNKESGEITYAEVMVPSKLRNNKGEMLDLYQKDGSEYKYIQVNPETGRFELKKGKDGLPMIQEHLLNLVTFRIPTSSHVSLSNVKIVGILPPESGDLILVPKNFTKQKGLDFDVDKENTYQLWTYVNQNGRVKELSQGYVDYLIKKLAKLDQKKLDNLKNEDSEYYKELLATLGSEENVKEFIENKELNIQDKIEDLKTSMKQKLIENEIIKIHSSVLGNPNLEVKNKINKILSMDFAKEQAENISMLKEQGKKNDFINRNINDENSKEDVENDYKVTNQYFSILSDEYQSYKMFLGAAGKSGIGVYSNFLTMSSLMQQYGEVGDFRLLEYDVEDKVYNNLNFNISGIGNIDGILGRINTLDGSRSISEVFEELQNTATDNEKEQIMGRTGINNHTIAVFSIMSMLGIDKTPISKETVDKYNLNITDNKMSFGNLLLSQNIVNQIVARLEYNNSNITEFDSKQVIDIIRDIKKTLKPQRPYSIDGEPVYNEEGEIIPSNAESDYDLLTGDNLIIGLVGDTIEFQEDFNFQILDLLERLYSFQNQFRNTQKVLNISSNGLGLDIIEANNYNQLLAKVVKEHPKTNTISNVDKLLFKKVEDVNTLTPEEKEKVVYVNEFNVPLIPTTPIGASILNSFSMTKKLYGDFFPYQNYNYRKGVELAMSNTKITGNSQAKLNFERKFAKEFKKFLMSRNPLYTGSAKVERERLFFDTPNNTSLANYMKELISSQDEISNYVARNLLNNPLIKKLTFDINHNNKKNIKNRYPSTIKYNDSNSIVENRDILYRALPELLESNIPLPPFNGQDYSTRLLAQDLISYAFLEGGVQEIIQFAKYVPISYLEVVGFTEDMRTKYAAISDNLSSQDSDVNVPSFIRQFFQHNSELATRIDSFDNGTSYEVMKSNGVFDAIKDNEFTLKPKTINRLKIGKNTFVSVYDPKVKGKNKYILFEKDPNNPSRFVKRDTAGYFGLSEYDSSKRSVKPLKKVETDLPDKPVRVTTNRIPVTTTDLGIEQLSTKEVIDNMLGLNNEFSKIFEPFKEFIPNGLTIEIQDTDKFNGSYSPTTNKIIIAQSVVEQGPLYLSNILVKELMHSVTTNYVSNYLNPNGTYKSGTSADSPLPVRKLAVLYRRILKEGATIKNSDGVTLLEFVQNFKRGSTITQENLDKFYGFTDIFEFIEMSMTSPEFRGFLDSIEESTGGTLLDRLKEIFKDLWVGATNNTVSKKVVNTVTELVLTSKSNINTSNTDNDSPVVEDVLNRAKGLLDNNNNSNFATLENDPFLC